MFDQLSALMPPLGAGIPEDFSAAVGKLDIAIIAVYMLVVLGIGVYYRKFASGSLENYFLAGRKLPGWMNGFSYAATCMNTDVAPAYCGFTVGAGLFVCWLYFSRFGLALMIGGILFAIFWRKLKLFTSPEFYEIRYPGKVGSVMRGWIAARSAFIAIVAWSGAGLLGICKVTGPVFGWSKELTLAVAIPLVLTYVLLAGYMGVVTTDILQSAVMIGASLVMCAFVLVDFGGPGGLLDALNTNVGPEVTGSFPPLGHADLGLIALVAWVAGTAIGYGGDTAPMGGAMEGQRILSNRNEREAAKMYVWTQVILFVLLMVLTLPALGALAKWPELHTAGRGVREEAFGRLLVTYMPAGFLGLAVAAMIASIMSTIDSNLNFGAQVVASDLYKRFARPKSTDRELMWVGRVVMLVIMGLAVLVAYRAESLITVAVFMLGLSSAELAANWAQWWWWRFNGAGRLAASFGGPLIFVLVKFVAAPHLGMTEYAVVLSSIGLTTLLWIAATLLTRPQDEETLKAFYLRARPLGAWGPIRASLGIELPPEERWLILKGFGLALLGATWIACAILGASNLFVGKYLLTSIFGAAASGGGLAFYFLFRKYVAILQARVDRPVQAPGLEVRSGPLGDRFRGLGAAEEEVVRSAGSGLN
jgi:Na+/proline symporter